MMLLLPVAIVVPLALHVFFVQAIPIPILIPVTVLDHRSPTGTGSGSAQCTRR